MPQREARFTVNAPPAELWKFIRDMESLCTCIPGVEKVVLLDGRSADLTVRENLVVAFQPRSSAVWTLERVFELFPRLRERSHQYAGSLSGGEQQMLAIGRALMGNPRLLLMDEPSEGLAPLIVADVGRTIARLKAQGQSILLVEQNVKMALELADEAVILNTGRVAFSGPAADVRDNHQLVTQHLGVF